MYEIIQINKNRRLGNNGRKALKRAMNIMRSSEGRTWYDHEVRSHGLILKIISDSDNCIHQWVDTNGTTHERHVDCFQATCRLFSVYAENEWEEVYPE